MTDAQLPVPVDPSNLLQVFAVPGIKFSTGPAIGKNGDLALGLSPGPIGAAETVRDECRADSWWRWGNDRGHRRGDRLGVQLGWLSQRERGQVLLRDCCHGYDAQSGRAQPADGSLAGRRLRPQPCPRPRATPARSTEKPTSRLAAPLRRLVIRRPSAVAPTGIPDSEVTGFAAAGAFRPGIRFGGGT